MLSGTICSQFFPPLIPVTMRLQHEAAVQGNGSPCAFACIQSAKDWLATEGWKNALAEQKCGTAMQKSGHLAGQEEGSKGSKEKENEKEKETVKPRSLIQEINASGWAGRDAPQLAMTEEEAEKREWECVITATEEACRRAAGVMRRRKRTPHLSSSSSDAVSYADRNGLCSVDKDSSKRLLKGVTTAAAAAAESSDGYSSDDGFFMEEKIIAEAALSARGVWAYTVGLVGKPSAGRQKLSLISFSLVREGQ